MRIRYSLEKIKSYQDKKLYALNEVCYNNWIRDRILWIFINFTKITPNQVTSLGFCIVLISAFMFFTNHLILGAIFFNLRFVLDGVDGRLAGLKGMDSKFGAFWDNYTGYIGRPLCILALSYNQFNLTGNTIWFPVAFLILLFRSLHSWESTMVRAILGSSARYKQETAFGGLTSRAYQFLAKHKLAEPFNTLDLDILLFVAFPILSVFTGFLLEMWIFVLIIMFLKAIFWFYYYSKILVSQR